MEGCQYWVLTAVGQDSRACAHVKEGVESWIWTSEGQAGKILSPAQEDKEPSLTLPDLSAGSAEKHYALKIYHGLAPQVSVKFKLKKHVDSEPPSQES